VAVLPRKVLMHDQYVHRLCFLSRRSIDQHPFEAPLFAEDSMFHGVNGAVLNPWIPRERHRQQTHGC
jgi:hypothetical protein